MPLYSVQTDLEPAEIIEQAKAYFGEPKEGLGMEITHEDDCCINFSGGGGYVYLTVEEEEDANRAKLETREWDHHVQQFMGKIG